MRYYDDALEDEFIADRLEEARADADDAPAPGPIPERRASKTWGFRRTDAQRKRVERAKRKAAGMVEPSVLDAAIVTAYARMLVEGDAVNLIARRGTMEGMSLSVHRVYEEARTILLEKGATPAGARRMLGERLLGVKDKDLDLVDKSA
ncbi:hypothetical protein [Methylobacterium indicum]|uniref:hypothetical protein n=1 Tax=Methylobacterium indicum TaxID=1775910 RepID=UPI002435DEAE|nr:hypothetical protein [Methylobacterium indicum]